MYRVISNVSRKTCEVASSLLDEGENEGYLAESCTAMLIEYLDRCLGGESTVLDISDVSLLHLRFPDTHQRYYLTDDTDDSHDIFKDRFTVDDGIVYETLECFFVLCLEGSVDLRVFTDKRSVCASVTAGEAFFLDVGTSHTLASATNEVEILVMRCQLSSVIMYAGGFTLSSDHLVYEKILGVNFAIYRLSRKDKDESVAREILLANRRIYDLKTGSEYEVMHISQLLDQYNLLNVPLPEDVPESISELSGEDLVMLNALNLEKLFARVPSRCVATAAGHSAETFSVQIVYGVIM
ncbi:concanavalin-like precursor [Western grey kangaroopox virus]|uniref:Concanavalin-like n=1 Tax=Western grey kangaroopox virus TaxID=1566307 RepID=A0A2C9DSU5_9POXV|nr:concanavalin-like precursor [Western grey kangaroopox virus]ATI21078.1 concanavalin-like precursor [Western grey kangaroopox virus]